MLGDLQELNTREEVKQKLSIKYSINFFLVVCLPILTHKLTLLQTKLPKEYSWPEKKLKISVLPDSVFDNPLQ